VSIVEIQVVAGNTMIHRVDLGERVWQVVEYHLGIQLRTQDYVCLNMAIEQAYFGSMLIRISCSAVEVVPEEVFEDSLDVFDTCPLLLELGHHKVHVYGQTLAKEAEVLSNHPLRIVDSNNVKIRRRCGTPLI
jgi:hypothetical protein